MYCAVVPVPEDLVNALEPYRQRFDPLNRVIPTHVTLIKPFEFSGEPEQLYHHFNEVSERHAPIRVFLIGWDVHQDKRYQLHLPMTAGRDEFVALHCDLLTGLLAPLIDQQKTYQPQVIFGQFTDQTQLTLAKKSLKQFEPQFSFRVKRMELWQRLEAGFPWSLTKKFSLKATVAGALGEKRQA